MASQITGVSIIYSTVYSGTDQRKRQNYASLAFVTGIHRWRWIPRAKGPVTRKMFPFDDVIMLATLSQWTHVMIVIIGYLRTILQRRFDII